MAKKIGSARQSQLVTTYGVGSVIPVEQSSYMIMGIDDWPESAPRIDEPRLARAMGVHHFCAPPAGRRNGDVPVTRFPLMHYCPKCHRLGKLWELADDDSTWCRTCEDTKLVPSRFVACCEHGHIEDFPYFAWVHRGAESGDQSERRHNLTLRALGRSSSLSDILIGCSCGVEPKSLAGAFGKQALIRYTSCRGKRPWLPTDDPEGCDKPLRTLQRGSSNVWFSATRSTISIPPWSTAAAALVEGQWATLQHITDDALPGVVAGMAAHNPRVTAEAVLAVIARRKGVYQATPPTDAELRADEYRALTLGTAPRDRLDDFVCEPRDVPDVLSQVIEQISAVDRLREVAALEGFSRVVPHVPGEDRPLAPLSDGSPVWLPAMEIHGEGIFVRLLEDVVADWEESSFAHERVSLINRSKRHRDLALERPESPPVSARRVALHTLSHMLLGELSLHAGYPAAALRERVYAGDGQAGILIYTASSDSAGSLGGLAALADADRFAPVLLAAIDRAAWCSSDPVCAESRGSGLDNLNLAACHACLLLPETSCEAGNVFLDRIGVVGPAHHPEDGLLASLR